MLAIRCVESGAFRTMRLHVRLQLRAVLPATETREERELKIPRAGPQVD
jgi:hypothetical protein